MKTLIKSLGLKLFGDKFYTLIGKIRYLRNKKSFIRKANLYNLKKQSIIDSISHKDNINILFFVLNMAMWKYDGLVKLLQNHPRFTVTIVPFVRPEDRKSVSLTNRNEIISYCKKYKLLYFDGYDFSNDEYLNIKSCDYDIIIYTQPYNTGYPGWRIDNFINDSLFIYTPYGLSLVDQLILHDTYLTNIAWRIFAANKMDQNALTRDISSKISNVVITGASIYDQLQNADIHNSPWKSKNKKRIIWAPHHSIDSKNSFSSSNFERICWDMINISKKYLNEIEFIFKPHPLLKERLIDKWGLERTEEYYRQWETMPNTSIKTGSYTELFAFSDAMIHDCSSFTGEYLFTGKPVMYVIKDLNLPSSINNPFGKACFECHYHGRTIKDIESFIKKIVLGGKDEMYEKRHLFVKEYLIPPNGLSTAQNMLSQLETLIQDNRICEEIK